MSEFIFKPSSRDKVLICKLANLQELVRCRECKHTPHSDSNDYWCDKWEREFGSDWFCADGEVATVKNGDSKDSGDVIEDGKEVDRSIN